MRILIIDDEPWYIPLEDLRWANPNVDFDLVTHPDEVDMATLDQYNAICVDHRMPVKKGDVVAHEIRVAGYGGLLLSVGSLRASGYPKDCPYVGKRVFSIPRFRNVLRYLEGDIDYESMLRAVRHGVRL